MTFRERVEEKPTFWLLSMLLAGFIAGTGTYEAIIRIAQLEVISKAELEKLRRAAKSDADLRPLVAWSGSWETDTETYKNLRIRFTESKGEVTGAYRVPGQTSQLAEGRIEGSVNGNALVGRWMERVGNRNIGGEVHFVLLDDGRSFLGAYTREWEGSRGKHVWSGRRIE